MGRAASLSIWDLPLLVKSVSPDTLALIRGGTAGEVYVRIELIRVAAMHANCSLFHSRLSLHRSCVAVETDGILAFFGELQRSCQWNARYILGCMAYICVLLHASKC